MAGNEKVVPSKCKLLVAAIDFGTTYSGWAFSFHHDFKLDATKITCKRWYGGNHVSDKAPTAVLVNPDGETMEAFGYDAEDKYAQLLNEEEHEDYFFFQHFKMLLYNKKNLSRQLELEDITGKRLPAKRVFAMVIKCLKNDMLREVGKKLLTGDLADDDIQWVLTVPAIWNVRAKQFMRECAVEAGIKSTNLLIALEPETASIYCKHFIMTQQKESSSEAKLLSAFQPGARYMVLDAGGGTIDIIVHEVESDGSLDEIYAANGGNWGGRMVDKAFLDFLANVFGETVMQKFKKDCLADYFDLVREIEIKKRNADRFKHEDSVRMS